MKCFQTDIKEICNNQLPNCAEAGAKLEHQLRGMDVCSCNDCIRILPDEFLLKSTLMSMKKRNLLSITQIYEHTTPPPPPPPPNNALLMSLSKRVQNCFVACSMYVYSPILNLVQF